MNSRITKFPGFVFRVVPSRIKTRFGFGRKKKKNEDGGLHETVSLENQELTSMEAQNSHSGSDLPTSVQRRGKQGKVKASEDRLRELIFTLQQRASSRVSAVKVTADAHPATDNENSQCENYSTSNPTTCFINQAIDEADNGESFNPIEDHQKPSEAGDGQENSQRPGIKLRSTHIKSDKEIGTEIIELPPVDGGDSSAAGEFDFTHHGKSQASTSLPQNRRQSAHARIDLEDIFAKINTKEKNLTYTESYMKIMYNCGLSPFLPEGASPGFWGCCQAACFAQVVLYWAFTIGALLETLAVAKFKSIVYMSDGGLEEFTNMCFFIMNVFVKIYSAYLFTMQQQKFAKMIKSICRLRAFAERYSKVEEENYQTPMVYLLAIISLIMSTLSVVFSTGLIGWTPEDSVLLYTYKASAATYLWSTEDYKSNSTGLALLYKHYRFNITAEKAFVGLLFGGMRLCNRAMASANADLILTTGATIKKQMYRLAKEVGNPKYDINPVTLENFQQEGGQWEHYQLLQEAVDNTNDTFDCLLKYMHVENVMMFVYIVMNAFDGEMKLMTILYFVYNIVKASCTYRVATQASEKNQVFRDWIRRLIWKSSDQEFTTKAYAIIDKMKEHPLGLGRGMFLIDESFVFRFLGTVGSVFVLQAQSREAAETSSK